MVAVSCCRFPPAALSLLLVFRRSLLLRPLAQVRSRGFLVFSALCFPLLLVLLSSSKGFLRSDRGTTACIAPLVLYLGMCIKGANIPSGGNGSWRILGHLLPPKFSSGPCTEWCYVLLVALPGRC
eukprot:IDg22064t1